MFFNKKTETPAYRTPVIEAPVEEIAEELPRIKPTPVNMTKIGEGITFYGDFETEEPMEINGRVEGNIHSTTSIEISSTGSYKGDASMENLVLSGTADGNINCGDLTKLTGTGNMVGDLSTSRLITEDGSNFGGNLQLVSARSRQDAEIAARLAEESNDVPASAADAVFEAAEAVFGRDAEQPSDEDFLFSAH